MSITSFISRVKKIVGTKVWDDNKVMILKSGKMAVVILPDNGNLYKFEQWCAEYEVEKVARKIAYFLITGSVDKRTFWQIYGENTPLPPEFSGIFGFDGDSKRYCPYHNFLSVVRSKFPEVGIQEVPRPTYDCDIKTWV